MKHFSVILLGLVLFCSCKKTHSCSCTVTTITMQVATPDNGGAASHESNTTIDHQKTTFSKVKKRDVNQLMDCTSRSDSHTNSYRAVVEGEGTSEVTETTDVSYQCEVR